MTFPEETGTLQGDETMVLSWTPRVRRSRYPDEARALLKG